MTGPVQTVLKASAVFMILTIWIFSPLLLWAGFLD